MCAASMVLVRAHSCTPPELSRAACTACARLQMADGIRVMIYAGDLDLICNWMGNRRCVWGWRLVGRE